MRALIAMTFFTLVMLAAPGHAADPELTLKGMLVDASCVAKLGAGKVMSAEHVACAKDCFAKGQQIGIFDDELGLVKITGSYPSKHSARIAELLGQMVQAKGTRARGGDYMSLIDVATLVAIK
jgi:hypothetical protein